MRTVTITAGAVRDGVPDVPRFTMTAYDGGQWPLAAATGSRVVLDLTGAGDLDRPRPAVRDHHMGSLVGHTVAFRVAGGRLTAAGIVSGHGSHVDDLVASGLNGFPWVGDMGVRSLASEFVDRGRTVAVNGRSVAGPVTVCRAWSPMYVSFCTTGDNPPAQITAAADFTALADGHWPRGVRLVVADGPAYEAVVARAASRL